MTDIVDKLENWEVSGPDKCDYENKMLMWDAAKEIKRLRSELLAAEYAIVAAKELCEQFGLEYDGVE